MADPAHWQGQTRAIEDRLSDALHDRLTSRFVDRRTSVLVRAMREEGELLSAVARSGDVLVEGQYIGRLDGFRFAPDAAEGASAAKAVLSASARALKSEIAARVGRLAAEADDAFALAADGAVLWHGDRVARLVAGPEMLRPQVEVLASDLLEAPLRDRIRRRLADWLDRALDDAFRPLLKARAAPLKGAARGLVHQLAEALGSAPRRAAEAQVGALGEAERKELARLGIRLGVESVFMPALLKPAHQRLRALLWAAAAGRAAAEPPGERVAVAVDETLPPGFYEAVGYRVLGGLAVRVDMLERFAAEARRLARENKEGFTAGPSLLSPLGLGPDAAARLLEALGYVRGGGQGGGSWRADRRSGDRRRGKPARRPGGDSPFAVLRGL